MAENNDALYAAIRRLQQDNDQFKNALQQMQGFMTSQMNVPKFIEEIQGRRTPFFYPIEVAFSANSTARREGTTVVSADGPFICTGIALFFKKTDGAYDGIWGPATAFDARISVISQQHGFANLFDQPHCSSFTVEITAHGADRLWQSQAVASALYSPQAGGAFMLAAANLFDPNSTIRLSLTPDVSMPYASLVQGIFLGYKIITGAQYQP